MTKLVDYASDSTPENLANNDKLAEYDYHLRLNGRKDSATEKFWVPQDGDTIEVTNEIHWTYDEDNRLVDELFATDADTLLDAPSSLGDSRPWADYEDHYTYDLAGNRLEKTTDLGADGTVDDTTTSEYDENDRLETETTGDKVTTYVYDHTQQTSQSVAVDDVTQNTSAYTYNLQGQMLTATVTKYESGDPVSRTVSTYGYNEANQRISANVRTETNADENWTLQSETSTEYLTDGQNFTGYSQVLRETVRDAEGNVVSTTDYAIGLTVLGHTQLDAAHTNGLTYLYGQDGHGSVRLVLNMLAATAQQFNYDAYGNAVGYNPENALTTLQYNTEPVDPNTGLIRMGIRDVNPKTGIFQTLDSYSGRMNDPQSLHKYQYTQGDPVNGSDPSGQMTLGSVLGGLSIGAAVGVSVGSVTGTILAGVYATYGYYTGELSADEAKEMTQNGALVGAITGLSLGTVGGLGWGIAGMAGAIQFLAFPTLTYLAYQAESMMHPVVPIPAAKIHQDYQYGLLASAAYYDSASEEGNTFDPILELMGWARVKKYPQPGIEAPGF